MKTPTEMTMRYVQQREHRDAYIAQRVSEATDEWTKALEAKMELAHAGKEPVCTATVYSNQLTTVSVYHDHAAEILSQAALDAIAFFSELGFRARTIVCSTHTGVQVSWDPDHD